jgi:hypothetical protein
LLGYYESYTSEGIDKVAEEFFDILIERIHSSKRVKSNKKVSKGAWRMPWLSEAMKDVISCEKLRGFANRN